MNELNIINGRMSTLAFSELTGTRHDNVLEKAKKLLDDLEIGHLNFQDSYLSSQNKQLPMLSLDKDLSLTLAGQYEPKIAYHVAKAFNKPILEPSPKSALELAKEQVVLQQKLEDQRIEIMRLEHESNVNFEIAKEATTQINTNREWASVKFVETKYHIKVDWRIIKQWNEYLGKPVKYIEDQNYGKVRTYHKQAWLSAFNVVI